MVAVQQRMTGQEALEVPAAAEVMVLALAAVKFHHQTEDLELPTKVMPVVLVESQTTFKVAVVVVLVPRVAQQVHQVPLPAVVVQAVTELLLQSLAHQ